MIIRRAVSDGDKAIKRQAILDAASRLFESGRFNHIKMIDIARAAGMAKGTLFLYFRTKEELFLELTRQGFFKFFTIANSALEEAVASGSTSSVDAFVDTLRGFLQEDSSLLRLASITNAVLEQNISYEAALEFKTFLNENIERTGRLLEAYFPVLQPGKGGDILVWTFAAIIGIQQLSDPSEICKEVLSREDLPHLKVDFASHFFQVIRALLTGLGCR